MINAKTWVCTEKGWWPFDSKRVLIQFYASEEEVQAHIESLKHMPQIQITVTETTLLAALNQVMHDTKVYGL